MRATGIFTAAVLATVLALPAHAEQRVLVDTPCSNGAATGNPCNGNNGNGNSGSQGNANKPPKEKIVESAAPSIAIGRPAIRDRGVYISQIGIGSNVAAVSQTAPTAYARIAQDGERNRAGVQQDGRIIAYADLRQTGLLNDAAVTQRGSGGETILYVTQAGTGNSVQASQSSEAGAANGAILAQYGTGNAISLGQSGADNLARLTQEGDSNAMSASQSGNGNRLVWTQTGTRLTDLAISQTGGQSLQITQSR